MKKALQILDFNSNWNAKFLFAAYRSDKKQLDWILEKKLYNIRYNDDLFQVRNGAQNEFFTPDYILLYDCVNYSNGVRVFKWNGKRGIRTEKEMLKSGYPSPQGNYQVYGLGSEYKVPEIYLTGMQRYLELRGETVKFEPICLSGLEIIHAQRVQKIHDLGIQKLRIIDLFAGLGGFHHALDKLGKQWGFEVECVFASELKEDLRRLYSLNYGIPFEEINSDITLLDSKEKIETLVPKHDILCAGFPCQPFSQAGKQEGFEDSAGRGVLFNYIAEIIRYRRPKYIFLENVANLKNHDGGKTWSVIYEKLDSELGYDVREIILSPHEFGLPQHRKRIYIVGINREYGDLKTFQFPEIPSKPVCDITSIIEKDPVDIELIRPQYREYLRVWQEFLDECSKRNAKLPHPLWSMEFGATYPYEGVAPAKSTANILRKYKGALGKEIEGVDLASCLSCLPNYSKTDKAKEFPEWKKNFIRKNRTFYEEHKDWIDPWKEQIKDWPDSFIKFEWNCDDDSNMSLEDKIIQFRPSGIRVKRPTYSPALTFMGNQIPIFPWVECKMEDGTTIKGRHMTIKEAARVQGMQDLSFEGLSKNRAYEALGNAVDVDIVKLIFQKIIDHE